MMDKPYPISDPVTARFWEACNEGILLYQECSECGQVQSFPRAVCVECGAGASALAWRESGRAGTLSTYSLVYRGPSKAFKDDQPYLLALVELAEGFRLMVNLLDCEEADLSVGMAISIDFEKRGPDGQSIPQGTIKTRS